MGIDSRARVHDCSSHWATDESDWRRRSKRQTPPLEVPMSTTHVLTHLAVSSRGSDGQPGKSAATAMRHSPRSRRALWAGRVLSGFAVLFLLFRSEEHTSELQSLRHL